MKPIFRTDQPHELAVLEAALDPKGRRFATLAEDEARGVRLGPEDAQFAREYGRRNPEIAADIALFAQIGALGTPRDAGNELSDAEFAARALKTVAEKAGARTWSSSGASSANPVNRARPSDGCLGRCGTGSGCAGCLRGGDGDREPLGSTSLGRGDDPAGT